MKKIIIIGSPGSGKSTFARKLSGKLGIDVCHIDNLYWNADKTFVSDEELVKRISHVMEDDRWIMDGNFSRTLDMRLRDADTVFLFDLPVEVCIESVRNRIGTVRPDIPWVEEKEDEEFMEYIRNFPETRIPRMKEMFGKYPDKEYIIFKTRKETEEFLDDLN